MKRTLKRELKGPEIVGREAIGLSGLQAVARSGLWVSMALVLYKYGARR